MSAADWIMRAATHNAPLDRREWAHAMEAEFETLERGKLGWALGCWSAMAQWRMRDDLPFLALLVVITLLSWKAVFWFPLAYALPHPVVLTGIYPGQVELVLLCAALSALRPDRAFLAALTLLVTTNLHGAYVMVFVFHRTSWHINDAPPLIGVMSEVGACFVGCQIGIAIHRLLHRKR